MTVLHQDIGDSWCVWSGTASATARPRSYLSDEEVDDLLARLRDVLLPFTEKEARPGRRRRLLSTP